MKLKETKRIMAVIITFIIVFYSFKTFEVYAKETVRLLAFPGAEGGGKYTTGARAVEKPEIYHVENLNEKGQGSFADAISKSNRIIVFDVGGTIHYNDRYLRCKGNNLTILGQTAPGDGITIEGSDFSKGGGNGDVGNIIVRYLKIRPGDKLDKEVDGISILYASNIIVDHCSVSWAIDELVSILSGSSEDKKYALGKNITIQNCLMGEALYLSVHSKGQHSYGSIFGTDNSTLYHSVYAHNFSRNPAIYREIKNVNVANNIIYDWGGTASYGAQPYSINFITYTPCSVNYTDNFFKYGPSTRQYSRNKFYNVDNASSKVKSSYYFSGNVLDGNDEIIQDNFKGITNIDKAVILEKSLDLGEYKTPEETAYETYETILDTVGAYIPKRDAIDAKIIADVKNGTGRAINSPKEVGGYIVSETVKRRFEISEEWKELNSMGNAEENDIVPEGKYKGYTWIEAYVFDMEEKSAKPTNPDIIIQSPAIDANTDSVMGIKIDNGPCKVINEGESFKLKATAIPRDGTDISKIEIYDSDKLIDTITGKKNIDIDISPEKGTHYYICRAYNTKGEATNSTTAIVFVNPAGELPKGYSYATLGRPMYKDYGKASVDENGIYTVGGSGRISSRNSCGFMYRAVKGDFSISVKTEEIPTYESGCRAGIMLTDNLSDNSRIAMLSDHLEKFGENIFIVLRNVKGQGVNSVFMRDKDGNSIENTIEGYNPKLDEYRIPKYMRIERKGDIIKFSVSDDGIDWTNNPRQPYETTFENLPETLYVGLGVESNPGKYPKSLYSMAKFSNLKLIEYNNLVEAEHWKINDVKNNIITVSNEIKDGEITPDGKKINVYTAVYKHNEDGEKRLEFCSVGSFVTDKGNNVYNVKLDKEIDVSNNNIKVFLWDDNMRPVSFNK